MTQQPYTEGFYQQHRERSLRSARVAVPLIVDLLRPRHVVDVGCGTGLWLAAFRECGVADVLGLDGSWVEETTLAIPRDAFRAADLRRPITIDRTFDLAICIEVAEHLPAEAAHTLVASLTRLAPLVVFSAAIPYQGGTDHVNEQWPDYWVEHFRQCDYVAIDPLRPQLWDDPRVEYCYAQNILLFVRRAFLDQDQGLRQRLLTPAPGSRALVHPRQYLETVDVLRTVQRISAAVCSLIPPGHTFVLVDDAYLGTLEQRFGVEVAPGRRAIPFLERDGQYWGAPADSETARTELDRLRRAGATFVVFAWTALWWLSHYADFARHLRTHFPCVHDDDRLVVFDLQAQRPPASVTAGESHRTRKVPPR